MNFRSLCLILLMLCPLSFLNASYQNGLKTYFLQNITEAHPGDVIALQIFLSNQTNKEIILVDELTFPAGWSILSPTQPYNRLYRGQTYTKTIFLKASEQEDCGNYTVRYRAWARDNINQQSSDETVIIIQGKKNIQTHTPSSPPILQEDCTQNLINENSKFFQISSPRSLDAKPGEILFISTQVFNELNDKLSRTLSIESPEHWVVLPSKKITIAADSLESNVHIFGIKVPTNAIAGQYLIEMECEGEAQKHKILVNVLPEICFSAHFEEIQERYQPGEMANLKLVCENNSNVAVHLQLESETNPLCKIFHSKEPFFIEPHTTLELFLSLQPDYDPSSDKQFVFFKIINLDNKEQIYQHTLSITTCAKNILEHDLYRRIPAYFKTIALGENGSSVFGIETAGTGIIDPERNRFIDYFFRLPTNNKNVIYSIDQCIYTGIWEDTWNIDLGDTVYNLTPLTQNNRYGRGAGFNIETDLWSLGGQYTQNTYNNDYNPKESCFYVSYSPSLRSNIALNFMHKELKKTPTANILTLSSEFEFFNKTSVELEYGLNLAKKNVKGNKNAYRIEMQSKCFNTMQLDIEKLYAGSAFYGYYQDFNAFSSSLDYPLSKDSQANVSYIDLKQNVNNENNCAKVKHKEFYNQHQKQANFRISHQINHSISLSFNGLLLRAKQFEIKSLYNFYQQWGGLTSSFTNPTFSILATCSFGQQKDYIKKHSLSFLQQYYLYATKNFSHNIWASLFYEGGNTNYYEAKPWRNALGGSIRYNYGFGSWILHS